MQTQVLSSMWDLQESQGASPQGHPSGGQHRSCALCCRDHAWRRGWLPSRYDTILLSGTHLLKLCIKTVDSGNTRPAHTFTANVKCAETNDSFLRDKEQVPLSWFNITCI